jgi:hypothetical protein
VAAGREDVHDETVVVLRCDGTFDSEVKGESHYQDAIRACVAGADLEVTSDDACSCESSLRLAREPQNACDANAVAVRSGPTRLWGICPARSHASVPGFLIGSATQRPLSALHVRTGDATGPAVHGISGSGLTFRIRRSLRLPSANWHVEAA